jgi:hypothetical protein
VRNPPQLVWQDEPPMIPRFLVDAKKSDKTSKPIIPARIWRESIFPPCVKASLSVFIISATQCFLGSAL